MNSLRASHTFPAERPRRAQRRNRRAGRVAGPLALVLWAVLPAALTLGTILTSGGRRTHFAGDFHYAFWPAAHRVLAGLSPYVSQGSREVAHATAFVYPAFAALLLVPFALVAHGLADGIFAGLELAAGLLMLRVLQVRDWRLYGLVLLCPAVFAGWTVANITLALCLGLAVCWRRREDPRTAGILLAVLISVKLFLWPLLLWPLATRRVRTLAWTAAAAATINVVSWAALGFSQLSRYDRLLHALVSAEERSGFSLLSLARNAGLPRGGAWALVVVATGCAAVACLALGRRGRDLDALALALAASLLATPIVQLHYFALLLVPLAIARPRIGLAWAPPLLMWIAAAGTTQPWQIALALVLSGASVALVLRAEAPGRSPGRLAAPLPRVAGATASTFV